MKLGFLAIAVLAGILNPFLGGTNTSLSRSLQQPVWAIAATFALALSVTLLVALATGQRLPDGARIVQAPWWSWLGGLFAAGFVLALTLVARQIGASIFTGITVTAGIAISIVLDHYGLVGYEMHRASVARVIGAVVMTAGLGLILKY